MDADLDVARADFERFFLQMNHLTGRPLQEEMHDQARLLMLDTMKVTPPFHQGAGQGVTVAKKAGERSISANIDRLFIGKTLVGSRNITHLFGRTDVPGLPYVVPTVEQHPDVAGIYAREKRRAQSTGGRKMRFNRTRLTVSRKKVLALKKAEQKKVGWLASGWAAAATRFGATVSAYVKRHGTRAGTVQVTFTRELLRIVGTNSVRYARGVSGLEKRIQFALKKRTDAMRAQIPRMIERQARARRISD
jgi:hypothetical protein